MAQKIVGRSDENGLTGVGRRPIAGREAVLRFFHGLQRRALGDTEARLIELNGAPALLILVGGVPFSTLSFYFVDGVLQRTYSVVNPEKLMGLRIYRTMKVR